MISTSIVARRVRRNDPHSLVSLMVGTGKLRDHRTGLVMIKQAKPHRNRSQHARLDHFLIVVVERERITAGFSRPECLVQLPLFFSKIFRQLLANIVLAYGVSEVGSAEMASAPRLL